MVAWCLQHDVKLLAYGCVHVYLSATSFFVERTVPSSHEPPVLRNFMNETLARMPFLHSFHTLVTGSMLGSFIYLCQRVPAL